MHGIVKHFSCSQSPTSSSLHLARPRAGRGPCSSLRLVQFRLFSSSAPLRLRFQNIQGLLRELWVDKDSSVGDGSTGHPTALLLVDVGVEGHKEEQVGGEQSAPVNGSKLLAGARAHIGQVGRIGGCKVGVGGKVDKAQINDKLDDLRARHPLLPPHAYSAGGEEIVPVHDDMHGKIERDGHP